MDQKKETQPDQQTIDEILNLFKSGKLNNAKIKIEIIVQDNIVEKAMESIKKAAYSGKIGDGKISIKTIEDTAINKLRKIRNEPTELQDLEIEQDDEFNKIYKGEISRSGAAILPSKRVRKIPEQIIPKIKTEDIKDTKESIAKEEVQKDSLQEEKKSE